MRRWILLVAFLAVLAGCDGQSESDKELQEKTEQSMREANAQIGMPAIKNFQERKLAKQIFELCDQENLICYAYIVNQMQGKLVFIGKCVGFGLPYSVQYTNPQKIAASSAQGGYAVVSQADPNGLFMPEGLSATWLMMLDNKGEPHPVYLEPEIVVSPFPLGEQ
jgi:hypothetical protein